MAWIATFDFTLSDGGWINDAAHSRAFGVYSGSTGWTSVWGSVSGFDERLYLIRSMDFTGGTITDVEAFYTTTGTVGTTPVTGILVNDITRASTSFTSPNTFSLLATGLSDIIGGSTTVRTSNVGGGSPLVEGGLDILCTKIVISGTGTNPFTGFDVTFDLTGAGIGTAANAMGVAQSGAFLFFALEDENTGNQIVLKVVRPTSTTPSTAVVYNPGSGSSGNIVSLGDPDRMLFYGNFGTDIGVIDHVISSVTNNDISPTSIGAKLIQPLNPDLGDIDHIVAINRDDQDAIETTDGGSNWSTLNAAIVITADAMASFFHGQYFPGGSFIGGNDGVDERLSYTPNEFADLFEHSSAALQAVGSIVSIDRAAI